MTTSESPVTQTGAWIGNDDVRLFLVRLYSDGKMTGAVKDLASGRYTPEVALSPEAGWWDEPSSRLSVIRSPQAKADAIRDRRAGGAL